MPRLGLGALVAPLLVVLFRMGMLPEAHAAMLRAQEQLAKRRDQCQPAVEGIRNPARELARRIDRDKLADAEPAGELPVQNLFP